MVASCNVKICYVQYINSSQVEVEFVSSCTAAGSDYSPISTMLTFTSGTSEQCAHISILEDSILENPENFLVHLATSDEDVKLQYNYSTITILDNDGMKAQEL